MSRETDDGPINIDSQISFMEDFYSYTYMYQFKRQAIYGQGGDSDTDSDDEKSQD